MKKWLLLAMWPFLTLFALFPPMLLVPVAVLIYAIVRRSRRAARPTTYAQRAAAIDDACRGLR